MTFNRALEFNQGFCSAYTSISFPSCQCDMGINEPVYAHFYVVEL